MCLLTKLANNRLNALLHGTEVVSEIGHDHCGSDADLGIARMQQLDNRL